MLAHFVLLNSSANKMMMAIFKNNEAKSKPTLRSVPAKKTLGTEPQSSQHVLPERVLRLRPAQLQLHDPCPGSQELLVKDRQTRSKNRGIYDSITGIELAEPVYPHRLRHCLDY